MKKYKVNEYLLYPNEDLTLDDEQLITRDNVQHLGELLALSAIKSILAKGRDIRYLYLGLLKNIHCPATCEQTIPDGYDIAQNSISYLCEHIGKRLGDTIISRYGKPISVRIGCLRNNGCYINNTYARPHDRYTCFDEYENILTCDIEEQVSYEEYDSIIAKLHLTAKQQATVDCYMAGMGFVEVAKYFNITLSGVWRRKLKIKQKYISIFGDIE